MTLSVVGRVSSAWRVAYPSLLLKSGELESPKVARLFPSFTPYCSCCVGFIISFTLSIEIL